MQDCLFLIALWSINYILSLLIKEFICFFKHIIVLKVHFILTKKLHSYFELKSILFLFYQQNRFIPKYNTKTGYLF